MTLDIYTTFKNLILSQADQNELCDTEVVWIDREDLLQDLESSRQLQGSELSSDFRNLILSQLDQNELCDTEVVWIDREDLLESLDELEKNSFIDKKEC